MQGEIPCVYLIHRTADKAAALELAVALSLRIGDGLGERVERRLSPRR